MSTHKQEMFWVKRVEDLIRVLEGSTIGELELVEAGTEIIIRRRPDMVMTPLPNPQMGIASRHSTPGWRSWPPNARGSQSPYHCSANRRLLCNSFTGGASICRRGRRSGRRAGGRAD